MATVTLKSVGDKQFGGATPYGNVTTIRATLTTNSSGGATNASSSAALAQNDVVNLAVLPQGFVLEDAQLIVSTTLTASVTGSLGFAYVDGVDSTEVPQDDDYFGATLNLNTAGRVRTSATNAPVKLAKDAYLTLKITGANNAKAGRVDVIVHGERLGPR